MWEVCDVPACWALIAKVRLRNSCFQHFLGSLGTKFNSVFTRCCDFYTYASLNHFSANKKQGEYVLAPCFLEIIY